MAVKLIQNYQWQNTKYKYQNNTSLLITSRYIWPYHTWPQLGRVTQICVIILEPSLVQVMACSLIRAKLWPKPMMS